MHDRDYEDYVKKSLNTSSYLDVVYDAIVNKKQITPGYVPDLSSGGSGNRSSGSQSNESESIFHLDLDDMISDGNKKDLATIIGLTKTAAANTEQYNTRPAERSIDETNRKNSSTMLDLTKEQIIALRKYPSLVGFLGSDLGDSIAREIVSKINDVLCVKIGKNSRIFNKSAKSCVADRQNMKQYFAGENNEWVCCVIASGPFRGNEVIHFDPRNEKSVILRKNAAGEIEDITSFFNVVHDYAKK